jgi:hypothetical protein
VKTLVAILVALVALLLPPGALAAPLPRGFMGVLADGPLVQPGMPLARETRLMARNGVQTMRTVLPWASVQPFRQMADVPAAERGHVVDGHGVPTDFRVTDRLVRAAVRNGIDVLPVVQVAPDWAARHPGPFTDPKRYASPPVGVADYALFLRTLVERYGPQGSFWHTVPAGWRRPIRRWQIWNEPMIESLFWSDQPFASDYVALLRAARRAVHAGDPGAEVLAAGLPNLGPGRASWNWLSQLYAAGAHGAFDAVAIHPFSTTPENVLRTVARVRWLMRAHGDARVPIVVTELAWTRRASLRPRPAGLTEFDTTFAGQARNLIRAYELLAAARQRLGIEGVVWANWLSAGQDPGDWTQWSGLSGLHHGRIERTPALAAFRAVARRLEAAGRTVRSRRAGTRSNLRTT